MARVVGSTDHTPNHPDHHFDDFTSRHPSGVQFVRADGSIARINDSIELAVYVPDCSQRAVVIIAIFPMVFAERVGGEILARNGPASPGRTIDIGEVVDRFLPLCFHWLRRACWIKMQVPSLDPLFTQSFVKKGESGLAYSLIHK